MIPFKDKAHQYGMCYEEMDEIGDAVVWEFIMWNQNCGGDVNEN